MNRSAHPLHSGSPTNAGVSVKPQHLISFTNVFAVYWLPQSCRRATPRATFGAIEPKAVVMPRRIGSSAAHPSPPFATLPPPTADLRDVPAHDLGRVVIDRAKEPAPALALGVEARRVRAPHLVGPRRHDRPRVRRVTVLVAGAARHEQVMRPHQAQDALAPH